MSVAEVCLQSRLLNLGGAWRVTRCLSGENRLEERLPHLTSYRNLKQR